MLLVQLPDLLIEVPPDLAATAIRDMRDPDNLEAQLSGSEYVRIWLDDFQGRKIMKARQQRPRPKWDDIGALLAREDRQGNQQPLTGDGARKRWQKWQASYREEGVIPDDPDDA